MRFLITVRKSWQALPDGVFFDCFGLPITVFYPASFSNLWKPVILSWKSCVSRSKHLLEIGSQIACNRFLHHVGIGCLFLFYLSWTGFTILNTNNFNYPLKEKITILFLHFIITYQEIFTMLFSKSNQSRTFFRTIAYRLWKWNMILSL